jgi:hypothetical protein
MRKNIIILLLNLFVCGIAIAQYAQNYKFSTSSQSYIEFTGTRLEGVSTVANNAWVDLGFSFRFGERTYNRINVSSRGSISFNGDSVHIAALGGGTTGIQGAAYYLLTGISPNRVFTVQWSNWRWDNSIATMGSHNFQVKLYETSNKIEFHYGSGSASNALISHNSRSAFVGLKTRYNDVIFLDFPLLAAQPLVVTTPLFGWTPNAPIFEQFPDSGKVYTFLPGTCGMPLNLQVDSLIDNRCMLRWSPSLIGNALRYRWEVTGQTSAYMRVGTTPDTSSLVVEDMRPLTRYVARTYAICPNNDTSRESNQLVFVTDSALRQSLFRTSFETDSMVAMLPSVVDGWQYRSALPNGLAQAADSQYCLVALNYGFAVTFQKKFPKITSPAKIKRLSFKYWIANHPDYWSLTDEPPLKVELRRYMNGQETTRLLREYRKNNATFATTPYSPWQSEVFELTGYENQITSIVFLARPARFSLNPLSAIAIDDLKWEDISCPLPTQVIATPITNQTMLVKWQPSPIQRTMEIEYGLHGFAQGNGTRQRSQTDSMVLNALTPNQKYDFYIRTICGVGDTSEWSLPLSQVSQVVTQFPYTEGFDSLTLNPGWRVATPRQDLGWLLERETSQSAPFPMNGKGYLRVAQAINPPADLFEYTLYSPKLQLDAVPKRLVYHYFLGYQTLYYKQDECLNVEISTDNIQWTTLFHHTGDNSQHVYSGIRNPSWQRQQIDLAAYTQQPIWLRFRFKSPYSQGQGSNAYLDEVRVENLQPDCLSPTDLSVTGVRDDNSVEVGWTKGLNETRWQIEYGDRDFKLGTGTRQLVNNGVARYIHRSARLEHEEVYVRGICSNGDTTAWLGPMPALNARHTSLTNIYGRTTLDSVSHTQRVDWQLKSFGVNHLDIYAAPTSLTLHYLTDISAVNPNVSSFAILPRLTNLRQGTHQLRFRYRGRAQFGKLIVGLLRTRTDTTAFESLVEYDMLTNQEVWRTVVVPATNKDFLAFKATRGLQDVYLDSIIWERVPSCPEPVNVRITELRPQQVTVAWDNASLPNASPTSYRWRIVLSKRNPFGTNIVNEGIATTRQATITRLMPFTEYDLYVQAVCGPDTSTYWSNGLRFTSAQPNDECAGAFPLPLHTSSESITVPVGLAPTGGLPNDNDPTHQDIWYSFVTPSSVSTITLSTNTILGTASEDDWVIDVYKGDCGALTYVGGNDDYTDTWGIFRRMPSYNLQNFVPNTRYYVRLYRKSGVKEILLAGVCATCQLPPSNDDCVNAMALPYGIAINGYNAYATYQNTPTMGLSCENGQPVNDVWYKFSSDNSPERWTHLQLLLINKNAGDFFYMFYKGACDNLQPLKTCRLVTGHQTLLDTLFLLEGGQDYYLRLWTRGMASCNYDLLVNPIRSLSQTPLASAATTTQCQPFASVRIDNTNKSKWVSLLDDGKLVAEINANNNLLGEVTGGYFVNQTNVIRRASGVPYLDRNVGIQVSSSPSTDVTLRLYFSEQDRMNYWSEVGANPVAVTHYGGAFCMANTQAGSGDLLPAVLRQTLSRTYYVEFNTRRFSGFFIGPNQSLVFSEEPSISLPSLGILQLYPQPLQTLLHGLVSVAERKAVLMRLTDATGRTLRTETWDLQTGINRFELDMSEMPSGLYFLNLMDGHQLLSNKIIKQ